MKVSVPYFVRHRKANGPGHIIPRLRLVAMTASVPCARVLSRRASSHGDYSMNGSDSTIYLLTLLTICCLAGCSNAVRHPMKITVDCNDLRDPGSDSSVHLPAATLLPGETYTFRMLQKCGNVVEIRLDDAGR